MLFEKNLFFDLYKKKIILPYSKLNYYDYIKFLKKDYIKKIKNKESKFVNEKYFIVACTKLLIIKK